LLNAFSPSKDLYHRTLIFWENDIFDNDSLENLFDNTNTDVIGFCRITLQNGSFNRIGNLKQIYIPTGGDWLVNGSGATTYNSSLNFNHGCSVENEIAGNNDKGIYISPAAVNDDLTIFIGMKNN